MENFPEPIGILEFLMHRVAFMYGSGVLFPKRREIEQNLKKVARLFPVYLQNAKFSIRDQAKKLIIID